MYRNINLPPIEELLNQLSNAAIKETQAAFINGQIPLNEASKYIQQWIKSKIKQIMKIYYPYFNFYRLHFPSANPITRRKSKEYSLRKNIEK